MFIGTASGSQAFFVHNEVDHFKALSIHGAVARKTKAGMGFPIQLKARCFIFVKRAVHFAVLVRLQSVVVEYVR